MTYNRDKPLGIGIRRRDFKALAPVPKAHWFALDAEEKKVRSPKWHEKKERRNTFLEARRAKREAAKAAKKEAQKAAGAAA